MVFFSPLGEPLLNPYLVLNVQFGVSDDDIGKAYKKLMLQLHPDKQPAGQLEEEAAEVSRRFHDVMDAKSFLLDGEHLASRRDYDSRLLAAEKAKAAAAAQQQQAGAHQSSSEKGKNHPSDDPKKSKSTSKPNPPEVNKTKDTVKKPNITKKQWGRINRPPRRASQTTEKPTSEHQKFDRKNSCSTTSDDSCSDDEGPKSRNKSRNHQKKSHPTSSGKRSKGSIGNGTTDKVRERSDSNIAERSHATSSKGAKKAPDHDKSTVGKKVANKGTDERRSGLPEDKASSFKNESISECTKQQSRSANANCKLSESWHSVSYSSFFDDDDKKSRSKSDDKKTSVDAKAPEKSARSGSVDTASNEATQKRYNRRQSSDAPTPSRFDTFQPAVDSLTKKYLCPLTKQVINEPMTDFEGNNYERDAVLKYLETHSTSPVTGNPLYPMHLTPNTALKERIVYTLKLKKCLDTLSYHENSTPTIGVTSESRQHVTTPKQNYLSLRNSVEMFIKDLNAKSPNGIIKRLDSSGNSSFTYKGLDYTLQVPEGLSNNVIVQTWFDQDKKAACISARIVEWNRSLQERGLGGKLTFRNVKGRFAFTLTREMKPEKFNKKELKHVIEYYLEMSIKLHNAINVTDQKKVEKVRLQESCLAQ